MPIKLLVDTSELSSRSKDESDPLYGYKSSSPSVEPHGSGSLVTLPVHPTTRSEGGRESSPILHEPVGLEEPTTGEIRTIKAIGVRLCMVGQTFLASCNVEDVKPGLSVIIKLEQGVALGEVVSVYFEIPPEEGDASIEGEFIRYATAKDIAIHTENKLQAAEASAFCKTCIRQRSLDMKLVDVVVLHDKSKIIFFFTAPTRIDFRELVKDLVACYRTRIELRQIGVRHETQMLGGLGSCGQVCCCQRYLRKFAPVTIKMAKDQNLFLNPAKLSGLCGRLLCCLSFEQNSYEAFNARSPRIGKKYSTDLGVLRVIRTNMFNDSITCLTATHEEQEIRLEEWETLHPKRHEHQPDQHQHCDTVDEELRALDDSSASDDNDKTRKRPHRPSYGKGKGDRNKRKRSPQ